MFAMTDAYLNDVLFGHLGPNYFTRLAERQKRDDAEIERRIKLLVRIKAIVRIADIIDELEDMAEAA